ncbi:glycogen debranching N-terminal domain-containing protein [Agromyces sp. NPDC058484]|uniref:glycogen debranching N-terminal domain-containing protein n=1 Tax=Agromyces sp. NPDC058484 TaxID=3346524 RepID=UPI0036605B6B
MTASHQRHRPLQALQPEPPHEPLRQPLRQPLPPPLQPLLHDALAVLRAPTQVWSAPDGTIGSAPVHGVYFSDVRLVRGIRMTVDGTVPEHLATGGERSDAVRIDALLRRLDDPSPDPGVRLALDRVVDATGLTDTITVCNRRPVALDAHLVVELDTDASPVDLVKLGVADRAGAPAPAPVVADGVATWGAGQVSASLRGEGLDVQAGDRGIRLVADLVVPAAGETRVAWRLDATDAAAVVRGVAGPAPWSTPTVHASDDRLAKWIARALADLDALRMTAVRHPDAEFVAAGAPWFFTLFGRDSIWTARFLLPLGTTLAGDTLRVLAGMQGRVVDDATAEEPGKIMHELRRAALTLDDGAGRLPPLYYGTVDATALWIVLLADAWRWGLPDDEVRALLPHLEAALAWMRDHGDADGDGLLEYIDRSGRGLANQGWKDSGDSVQWRDGSLAEGPIALAEVQGYGFEAAMRGAELLEAFGAAAETVDEWRTWAARLRERFLSEFWIDDPAGAYPAIALDAAKRPVDTVTSNLGHLLGTGILDADQVELVVRRLTSPALDSGYGLRTMSTDAAGYWPLSYHGGSVWAHDTAIAILGLAREGRGSDAASLIEGLLRAASAFGFRMPELHSGDPATEVAVPVPYPAACRPQAWSAAASVAVLTAVLGLQPDGDELHTTPVSSFGAVSVDGLRLGARDVSVRVG